MRVALLLSGLSYKKEYQHFSGYKGTIDFRHYVKNIEHHLFHLFPCEDPNHDYVHLYVATNEEKKKEVMEIYHPVDAFFGERGNRLYKTIKGLQLVETRAHLYDFVVITRFDIYFLDPHFDRLRFDHFNMFSILESPTVCDDNFYFFPVRYLERFRQILVSEYYVRPNFSLAMHFLLPKLSKTFPLHFLHNEFTVVAKLTTFQLRFFQQCPGFWMNVYHFSEDVWYDHGWGNDSPCTMLCTTDIIRLRKKKRGTHRGCWIGYKITEPGTYQFSFDLYSDQPIPSDSLLYCLDVPQPESFAIGTAIDAMKWTPMEISVHVKEENNSLRFRCNDFEEMIDLQFRKVRWHKQPNLSPVESSRVVPLSSSPQS